MSEQEPVPTDSAAILKALLTNVKTVLSGKDESRQSTDDDSTFFSWMTPAMVFDPEELSFASKGINGGTLSAGQLQSMFEFSVLVNSIPKSETGVFNTDGARLDEAFKAILNQQSQIVTSDLTSDQKDKLDKYRKLLSPKVVEKYDEEREKTITITKPSPLKVNYDLAKDEYEIALNKFSDLRNAALNDSNGAAEKFATMGKMYKKKVEDAYSAWVTDGCKEEVEGMNAYIEQVTQKSLVAWKAHIQNQLSICDKTDLGSATQYCWTSFLPSGFATKADRWQKISFGHDDFKKSESKTKDSWGVEGGANWGLWSASAKSTGEKTTMKGSEKMSEYHISFGITQVMINRPWFEVSFLKSKLWRSKNGDQPNGYVSDGKSQGLIPAYPTFAIFINDLTISMKNSDSSFTENNLVTSSDASVGWGPFKIKGNYSNERHDKSLEASHSDGAVSIPGIQLIGFKCNRIDFVTPNTDPAFLADTTEWV